MAFVPEAWKRQVRTENDAIDMTGYRLCLLDRMRGAIRRRDLFVSPSFRFGDPRKGLLDGAAWDAAPHTFVPDIGMLGEQRAYISLAGRRAGHVADEMRHGVAMRDIDIKFVERVAPEVL
jgi:hypothetical protein